MLEINKLNKSFGNKTILKNVNLNCSTGEILGVFGRNGTGKSTLLKLIYGVLKADTIAIKVNGKILLPKNIISSKTIGYLPQNTFLPKELTVRKVISFFFSDGKDQDKIFYAPNVALFERLKIGQLRYLELLIIGNLKHSFLLLDEPFAMIAPIYKQVIKDLLIDLKKEKGIILTDHYYNDVLDVATKNCLIKDGNKIIINNKEELIRYGYLNS